MAAALQGIRFTLRCCQCQPSAHRYVTKSIGRRKAFSTSPNQRQKDISEADVSQILAKADGAQGADYRKNLESQIPEFDDLVKEAEETMVQGIGRQFPAASLPARKKNLKQTFLNMGEPEPFEDEDFEDDRHEDLSSLAHGELEQHREMRHYARLAAWEMPLLAKLAKPFVPPTADMPLRFRYTTYMGEQHPAEKKVVLEFCTADMPNLTVIQREKLKKLVGVRYNPETDIVRMSCEMFETQAQNKRHLGDLVDDLIREARDPTDTFEDVPLDTRHHTFKPKPKFPQEWVLTDFRRAELATYRENAATNDHKRMITGQIVDGVKHIEEALAKSTPTREALPEMVMAGGKVPRGKAKRLAVRRG